MKTTRQKRAAPFYAAAAVWLAYALVLPLYEPLHYALAAGASLLAFAAAAALCRGGPVGEEAGKAPPEKAEEPVEKKPASTGNPELDKMVRDGEMAIREMKRLDENIADPGISADIVRLEQVSAQDLRRGAHAPGEAAPDPALSGLLPAHHPEAAERL